MTIAAARLTAHGIARPTATAPAALVSAMGALQAQDPAACKWAVGVRLARAASDDELARALDDGALVRTHAMRGTRQLLARDDARSLLALVAPRLIASHATPYRVYGLDGKTLAKSERVVGKALGGGAQLTRAELVAALARAGIVAAGVRLMYLLMRLELEAIVCNGARRGKQQTWALFDERVPAGRPRARDAAAVELARRYFATRGPATVDDFTWWSSLGAKEARETVAALGGELVSETIAGRVYWRSASAPAPIVESSAHLLPPFDEYFVAYRARHDVLDAKHTRRVNRGGGMLAACIVIDGRIVGTWRRELVRGGVTVTLDPFGRMTRAQRDAVEVAKQRYVEFLG